jgi:hypothetical protein
MVRLQPTHAPRLARPLAMAALPRARSVVKRGPRAGRGATIGRRGGALARRLARAPGVRSLLTARMVGGAEPPLPPALLLRQAHLGRRG